MAGPPHDIASRTACHAVLVGPCHLPIQLGDVATWVGGIATAVALFLTWRLLRLTRKEQNRIQEEHRQAQARHVSAWCDNVGPDTVTVKLQNSSEEPIYEVRTAVGASWFEDGSSYREAALLYIVPPNHTQDLSVPLPVGGASDGRREASLPVEVIFYDAASQQLWLRDRFGKLTPIAGHESGSPAKHFFQKQPELS